MKKQLSTIVMTMAAVVCIARIAAAQLVAAPPSDSPRSATSEPFVLDPPKGDGPVAVRAAFQLHDINAINDGAESFQFAGVLTLRWRDERQAFDPAAVGVDEKVYQGDYQFNELSPGWFPQEILVNESGMYEKHGVVLRVRPDGSTTLVQTVNAIAKTELNLRRFPFDRHSLVAVFEVLGFDENDVVLQTESAASSSPQAAVWIPQWTIEGVSMSTGSRPASYAGHGGAASVFIVSVEVQRRSFFVVRLVMLPLMVIVLLSFSVFWMDRSSLGDRVNVSFIGILTGVAYQIVTSEILPHISYFTLMHACLNISFVAMCATVVINLIVGAMDKKGKHDVGNRIDRRCRWIFPLAYFGVNLLAVGAAFLFF